jgi:hypothetical protein
MIRFGPKIATSGTVTAAVTGVGVVVEVVAVAGTTGDAPDFALTLAAKKRKVA